MVVGLLVPAAVSADVPAGLDPNNPIQVVVGDAQTVAQTGQLAPLQEVWFEVTPPVFLQPEDTLKYNVPEDSVQSVPPLDLTLFVTPIDGNEIQGIKMDLFPVGYAQHWSHGHIYRLGLTDDEEDELVHAAPFGSGSVELVKEKDDVVYSFLAEGAAPVGKLVWSGRAFENEPILVRVRNETGSLKDFALFTADVGDIDLNQVAEADTAESEEATEAAVAQAVTMLELTAGTDPNNPISVAVADGPALLRAGRLPALDEVWFKVTPPAFVAVEDTDKVNVSEEDKDSSAPEVDLTLFITPADGNTIDRIHMELFPSNYAQHYSHGHIYRLGLPDDVEDEVIHAAPFGAGTVALVKENDSTIYSFLSEDGAPVAELNWSGRSYKGEPFYVRVANDSGVAKDFALFSGDIGDIDLSEVAQSQPAVAAETAQAMEAEVEAMAQAMVMAAVERGSDPNYAIDVLVANGQIVSQDGQLADGDEVWFAVTTSDIDDRYIRLGGSEDDQLSRPPLDMTLFFTPVDGNTVDAMVMELFPANYATHWSHGHIYRFGLPDDLEDEVLHAAPFGSGTVAVVSGDDEGDSIYSFLSEEGAPVGKLQWSGRAYENETILVRVANDTGEPVDFVLYTADVADFGE
jgi:hypothetical protein